MPPVFLFLFLPQFAGFSVFSKAPDSASANFVFTVQEQLFNDRFDSARSLCDSFITSQSESPIGYLFKAGTLLAQMSDREEALYSQELRKLVDTVIALCDKGLKTGTGAEAAYYYLWRGHAHVYRSLFESRFGSFTSAIKNGFRAHADYCAGLSHDSSLYDLYFGLGNYHYWKSVKAGILRTIGIVSNDIKKGIGELHTAIDSGHYFSDAAGNSLIWIYLDEKKFDSVIYLAETRLAGHPDSRTIRWPLASAHFEKKNFEKSAELYIYLREYFNQNPGNHFNLIECDYKLYQCFKKLGWKDKAEDLLAKVSEYRSSVPRATQRRQLAKLNYLRRELAR